MKCTFPSEKSKTVKSVEELILEYEKHPCCQKNCGVSMCGLPNNSIHRCSDCYPNSIYCHVTSSGNDDVSESEKKKRFHDTVSANRGQFERYYTSKSDSSIIESEKRCQLHKELKCCFYRCG